VVGAFLCSGLSDTHGRPWTTLGSGWAQVRDTLGVVKWKLFDRHVWGVLRQGSFGDRQMPMLLAAKRTGGSAEVPSFAHGTSQLDWRTCLRRGIPGEE